MMNTKNKKESINLNRMAEVYTDIPLYSKIKKDIIFDLIDSIIENASEKRVLQLGCASGYETEGLSKRFDIVDSVDGSSSLIEKLKNNLNLFNVNFICSLFEEYNNDLKYDIIFCNYVLEHVYDPVSLLKHLNYNLLKPNGILIIVVPNSNALSRQIALEMGIIGSLKGLTENDIKHGHRRTYNIVSIEKDITNSGFVIIEKRGLILKILSDSQLNKLLSDQFLTKEHIHALNRLVSDVEKIELSDSFFFIVKPKK